MTAKSYLKNLDSLVAALVGFYVIYLFTEYSGVGLSPDSIMYASTATNIQAHGSLLTFNQTPLVFFPVFYPFFLSIFQFIFRIAPITDGAIINELLFAAVIFTSGWIISKFSAHPEKSFLSDKYMWITFAILLLSLGLLDKFTYLWYIILILSITFFITAFGDRYKKIILFAIILSPGLLEVYTYLWSETLFILEILFFIVAYWRYMHTHTTKALMLAAIITAISCITRYAGVTIIGTAGLLLLLDNELPVRKKINHILLFGLVSISLLVGNLVLNRLSTGLSTGTREPSITSFADNLYYFGTVICDWGNLTKEAYPFAILIASVILLAPITILLWKAYKGRINSYENIVIAFAIVYGLFIVISASISRYERINSRLLAPMFIPLLIACTSWVPDVLILVKSKAKYVLAGVAVILMAAFEYESYQTDWQRYEDEKDYGVPGYSDDDWNKSEFVVYLKRHKNLFKPGIPIYTDADEAVYLFTGMSSTLIPHKFFKADVRKFYTHKRFYLIWFDNLYNSELLGLPDIMKNKKLVKIGSAKEGEIYYCDE